MNSIQPRAYRIPDACRILSLSRSHLYALAAAGRVKLLKLGGRTLVSAEEIERLLKDGAPARKGRAND